VIKHHHGDSGKWAARGTLTTQIKTNGFCEPCITEMCVGLYLSKQSMKHCVYVVCPVTWLPLVLCILHIDTLINVRLQITGPHLDE